MKGFTGDYAKFVDKLQEKVLDFLQRIKFSYQDIYILQACRNKTKYPLSVDPIPDMMANWQLYVRSFFKDPQQLAIDGFPDLLDFLDMVTFLHPEAGTVLIFSEIQSLNKLGKDGQNLLRAIIQSLETRKSLGALITVIFETSDGLWAAQNFFSHSIRSSREAFKGFLVSGFSHEEGRHALVIERKILSEEDYNVVWDALGGHPGSWVMVSSYRERSKQGGERDGFLSL